jgi:hypothetical protein
MAPRPRVKWATFLFWNVIHPAIQRHQWYYRRKVAVDQFLEARNPLYAVAIGSIAGLVGYFAIFPFLPWGYILSPEGSSEDTRHSVVHGRPMVSFSEMNNDVAVAIEKLRMYDPKDLPSSAAARVRDEVMGRVLEAMDKVEVNRERRKLRELKAILSAGNPSSGAQKSLLN